jgi:ankyrin repeat protein
MKELFEAIRAGDVSRVAALVEADPSLAIFAASIQGDTVRIEELLAANRSLISAVSTDGWTPLHLAAFFAKKDAVRVLLNNGATVNARSTNAMENTPLHAAAAGRDADTAKLLLHAAAQNGDVEMARALIASGADVQARAENNQNALDLALTKGQQTMVDFLETNGAGL